MKKHIALIAAVSVMFLTASCSSNKGPAGPAGGSEATAIFMYGEYPSNAYTAAATAPIVSNTYANDNYITSTTGWIGYDTVNARTLISFDVSSIVPAGVTINSAKLMIYVYSATTTAPMTVGAYSVLKNWTGTGATWMDYNASPSTWTTPGGDYNATPVGTVVVPSTGTNVYYTISLPTSLVQNWLVNPSQNYGLILKSTVETAGVGVLDINTNAAGEGTRPELIVNYSL
jgi:hypothetical protein